MNTHRDLKTIHADRDECGARLRATVAAYSLDETLEGLGEIKTGMRLLQRLYQEASDAKSHARRLAQPKQSGTMVRNVYMDADVHATLYKYGDGNLSAGVRRAAESVRLCAPSNN
jgi:hypothetical protein